MEAIKDIFGRYSIAPKKKARSEREDLISYFYDNALKNWDEKKYGPLEPSFIAVRLSHSSIGDLYWFQKELNTYCEKNQCKVGGTKWSIKFWGMTKVKK
jgi:hypothetical protein